MRKGTTQIQRNAIASQLLERQTSGLTDRNEFGENFKRLSVVIRGAGKRGGKDGISRFEGMDTEIEGGRRTG